jgi:hypothetical protein
MLCYVMLYMNMRRYIFTPNHFLHFTLTMILMMYAKGGNVNMTDQLCVEIYWNYQPFPTNIHANVLLNFLTYINMRYFCLYFVRKYPSVFPPCTIFAPGKVAQTSIYNWNIVEKWRLNTHSLIWIIVFFSILQIFPHKFW